MQNLTTTLKTAKAAFITKMIQRLDELKSKPKLSGDELRELGNVIRSLRVLTSRGQQ